MICTTINSNTLISYKNIVIDNNGKFIEINDIQDKPNVVFNNISLPYTFIMYDPDLNVIHWLIVNGNTVINYNINSKQLPKNETHRYIFRLYSGIPANLNIDNITVDKIFKNLKLIDQKYITTRVMG